MGQSTRSGMRHRPYVQGDGTDRTFRDMGETSRAGTRDRAHVQGDGTEHRCRGMGGTCPTYKSTESSFPSCHPSQTEHVPQDGQAHCGHTQGVEGTSGTESQSRAGSPRARLAKSGATDTSEMGRATRTPRAACRVSGCENGFPRPTLLSRDLLPHGQVERLPTAQGQDVDTTRSPRPPESTDNAQQEPIFTCAEVGHRFWMGRQNTQSRKPSER